MHPLRCLADAGCIASVWLSVAGALPAVLATIASAVIIAHYGIQIYDRLKHGRHQLRIDE